MRGGGMVMLRDLAANVRERMKDRNVVLDEPLADFNQLEARALVARFHQNVRGVRGWVSRSERRALYGVARSLEGPFLEIGPWAGLSTSIIAYAIRDGGHPKQFVTTELNPSLACWHAVNGGIGFFPPSSPDIPCGISSLVLFERDILPVIGAPGGVLGVLTRNLRRLGLAALVTVIEGDFTAAPEWFYNFLFVDTFHDTNEIEVNAERLIPYLHAGTVIACHDTTSHNETALRDHLPLGRSFQIDSLFVAEVVT